MHDAPPARGAGPREQRVDATPQFFAKLDFIPRSAESDTSLLTAVIAFGAVVIYCVKRNNPASADADAEMVPADAIANPTLFKRLLNA